MGSGPRNFKFNVEICACWRILQTDNSRVVLCNTYNCNLMRMYTMVESIRGIIFVLTYGRK